MLTIGIKVTSGISLIPPAKEGVKEGSRSKEKMRIFSRLGRSDVTPTRLLCPWDFPGNTTRVDCHFLLQGIFPTQGSNLGLLHCRQMLYCLIHQGSHQQRTSLNHAPDRMLWKEHSFTSVMSLLKMQNLSLTTRNCRTNPRTILQKV